MVRRNTKSKFDKGKCDGRITEILSLLTSRKFCQEPWKCLTLSVGKKHGKNGIVHIHRTSKKKEDVFDVNVHWCKDEICKHKICQGSCDAISKENLEKNKNERCTKNIDNKSKTNTTEILNQFKNRSPLYATPIFYSNLSQKSNFQCHTRVCEVQNKDIKKTNKSLRKKPSCVLYVHADGKKRKVSFDLQPELEMFLVRAIDKIENYTGSSVSKNENEKEEISAIKASLESRELPPGVSDKEYSSEQHQKMSYNERNHSKDREYSREKGPKMSSKRDSAPLRESSRAEDIMKRHSGVQASIRPSRDRKSSRKSTSGMKSSLMPVEPEESKPIPSSQGEQKIIHKNSKGSFWVERRGSLFRKSTQIKQEPKEEKSSSSSSEKSISSIELHSSKNVKNVELFCRCNGNIGASLCHCCDDSSVEENMEMSKKTQIKKDPDADDSSVEENKEMSMKIQIKKDPDAVWKHSNPNVHTAYEYLPLTCKCKPEYEYKTRPCEPKVNSQRRFLERPCSTQSGQTQKHFEVSDEEPVKEESRNKEDTKRMSGMLAREMNLNPDFYRQLKQMRHSLINLPSKIKKEEHEYESYHMLPQMPNGRDYEKQLMTERKTNEHRRIYNKQNPMSEYVQGRFEKSRVAERKRNCNRNGSFSRGFHHGDYNSMRTFSNLSLVRNPIVARLQKNTGYSRHRRRQPSDTSTLTISNSSVSDSFSHQCTGAQSCDSYSVSNGSAELRSKDGGLTDKEKLADQDFYRVLSSKILQNFGGSGPRKSNSYRNETQNQYYPDSRGSTKRPVKYTYSYAGLPEGYSYPEPKPSPSSVNRDYSTRSHKSYSCRKKPSCIPPVTMHALSIVSSDIFETSSINTPRRGTKSSLYENTKFVGYVKCETHSPFDRLDKYISDSEFNDGISHSKNISISMFSSTDQNTDSEKAYGARCSFIAGSHESQTNDTLSSEILTNIGKHGFPEYANSKQFENFSKEEPVLKYNFYKGDREKYKNSHVFICNHKNLKSLDDNLFDFKMNKRLFDKLQHIEKSLGVKKLYLKNAYGGLENKVGKIMNIVSKIIIRHLSKHYENTDNFTAEVFCKLSNKRNAECKRITKQLQEEIRHVLNKNGFNSPLKIFLIVLPVILSHLLESMTFIYFGNHSSGFDKKVYRSIIKLILYKMKLMETIKNSDRQDLLTDEICNENENATDNSDKLSVRQEKKSMKSIDISNLHAINNKFDTDATNANEFQHIHYPNSRILDNNKKACKTSLGRQVYTSDEKYSNAIVEENIKLNTSDVSGHFDHLFVDPQTAFCKGKLTKASY